MDRAIASKELLIRRESPSEAMERSLGRNDHVGMTAGVTNPTRGVRHRVASDTDDDREGALIVPNLEELSRIGMPHRLHDPTGHGEPLISHCATSGRSLPSLLSEERLHGR